MKTFQDTDGRSWSISIDSPTLDGVEEAFGVKLDSFESPPWDSLSMNPRLLVRILAFICRDQIKQANITDREFSAGVRDAVLDRAAAALLDAVIDFFPERTRSRVKSAWSKIQDLNDRAANRLGERLGSAEMTGRIDALVSRAIDQALAAEVGATTSGSRPAGSGSTSSSTAVAADY